MHNDIDIPRKAIQAGRILGGAGVFMNSPDVAHLEVQTNSLSIGSITLCSGTGRALMLGIATDNSIQMLTYLTELLDRNYMLKKPVPIMVRQESAGDWIAVFEEAEISRSGETAADAVRWVQSSIVTLYDLYKQNVSNLGPLPARQYRVLGEYLVKKPNPKA